MRALRLEARRVRGIEWLTKQAEDSLTDSRPSVFADQVFRELRAKYGQR